MEQFDAVLTGTDTDVNGVVTANAGVYTFKAIDDSIELSIAKDAEGNWERIAGSEPYLSGWIDELAEQIQTK
ncbi:hypothetical protein FPZ42_05945 [Mucilaginibacter achroorhodeus]|uniref:Uncharacterized protein n=1 Tax=Mucilaginibacter achroorhodeus TaxID=2599294 RepID=A0A563U5F5_9SPHI|nr:MULTISPECIES: hypothetical protein [Mucilaginibacter]QXV64600.1 hypothetical protein INP83_16095 [Mucilaginibacter sp. 21P]TWR26584.1 hypothetical protein FPZ42_05945 [Mucilaginibacter achroorhodeus]